VGFVVVVAFVAVVFVAVGTVIMVLAVGRAGDVHADVAPARSGAEDDSRTRAEDSRDFSGEALADVGGEVEFFGCRNKRRARLAPP
jgi:hypothetical protein